MSTTTTINEECCPTGQNAANTGMLTSQFVTNLKHDTVSEILKAPQKLKARHFEGFLSLRKVDNL